MKKIEKILILKDLDYINNELNIKNDKLKDIVTLFMDEEPDIIKSEIEEVKKEEAETTHNEETLGGDVPPVDETTDDNESIPEPESDISENPNSIDLPKDLKTIYRKIVMKTHPDKIKNSRNADVYMDFYKRAVVAKDQNDHAELIYIAHKLDIEEIFDLEPEIFQSVKNKIKELDIKSKTLENNAFWIWYHSENELMKRMMVEQISKIRNGNK